MIAPQPRSETPDAAATAEQGRLNRLRGAERPCESFGATDA